MKNRSYQYILEKKENGYNYKTIEIESEDSFEKDLIILAFPMSELNHADKILGQFGLREDTEYFYEQCREVISVPEKHINEKGEGKLTFQSYFHNFPHSVTAINDKAIVVVALQPKEESNADGKKDYWLVGYIHANVYDFKDLDGSVHEGFYYNMLRISERSENGIKVYRRKKIFTLVFSVLHSLVDVYGVHFAYAAMGKENQAINDALVLNSSKYNKHFEKFPMRTNTKINFLFGNKSASQKLVDITNDTVRLKEMYAKMIADKGSYVFQMYHHEGEFLRMVENIKSYSKSSAVYMIPDASGNLEAACVAMNWGDYFLFTLENPTGIFKLIASLKLTDNLLYPLCIVGSEKGVDTLLKGITYKYRKEHKCHLTLLNSYPGDPHFKSKQSFIFDEYQFFIISDRKEHFDKLKDQSKDEAGNVRYFIDNPIL
jgi:hypothetical protein